MLTKFRKKDKLATSIQYKIGFIACRAKTDLNSLIKTTLRRNLGLLTRSSDVRLNAIQGYTIQSLSF